jgi:nucleotide-binding universal stress UspA family protein
MLTRTNLSWDKILCPVDFSDESRAALHVAADFAKRCGAELTLLHAHGRHTHAVATEQQPEHKDSGALDRWKAEAESLGAPRTAVASIPGDPRTVIVEHAQRGGFDLIVMGTHGRTGRARLLIGSVAENVVRSSRVPVLTVHADFDRDQPAPAAP